MDPLLSTVSFQLQSRTANRPFLVDAFFLNNRKKKPVIIFIHGFKGFKDWGPFNTMAAYFASHGFVFVKFNLSHNGTTPEFPNDFSDLEAFGNDNHSIQLSDLDAVLDWITTDSRPLPEGECDSTKICLIGHSRGGSLVLLKAAREPRVQKIVTWAAVSDLLSGYAPEELEQWKKNGVRWIANARTHQQMPVYYQYIEDLQANDHCLNVLDATAAIQQPLLIIHAENDETVPLHHATAIHQHARQSELIIIPGTNHTFGGLHPFLSDSLPDSLQQLYDTSIHFLKK
jgi:dienelactone hydrolase